MAGKFIIVSAPSGAGKTTIVKRLLSAGLGLEFSVSAASRPPRASEVDGKDYHFMTADAFMEKIGAQALIEWQEVYPGHFYGTLRSEVERIWNNGHHVIFDVDVMGGLNLKKAYPDISLSIFVMPPSLAELEKRLRLRSTESEENLKKRLDKAAHEISFSGQFDRVLVNDDLEVAAASALEMVKAFLDDEHKD